MGPAARRRVVFASRNRHKAEQVAVLLPELNIVSLDAVAPGIELDEPFMTFRENALAKARAASDATGLPAVADDSGIEVDALDGAPGVHSARWAGLDATDAQNNAKLIAAMRDVPPGARSCRYVCVAAYVDGDAELVAEGDCRGTVVLEGRGALGFGYDPYVVPEGDTRTMGEIPLEERLAFSHRGRAFRDLARMIERDAPA